MTSPKELQIVLDSPGELSPIAALADIPEEEIWLAKQKSPRTRRAYKLDVQHFMGYLRALQHLDRFADLLDVEGVATEKWSARAIMRIEVGSIHRWQLNFQSKIFEFRFNQITETIEERLYREAAADGTDLRRGGFVAGVRDLRLRYLSAFNSILCSGERLVDQ
jgi:hypothetical protein